MGVAVPDNLLIFQEQPVENLCINYDVRGAPVEKFWRRPEFLESNKSCKCLLCNCLRQENFLFGRYLPQWQLVDTAVNNPG